MFERFPRWLQFALIIAALVAVLGLLGVGIAWLWTRFGLQFGLAALVLVVGLLVFLLYRPVQELLRLRKFYQYSKQHEESLKQLPTLLQSGQKREAVSRFEDAMKEAPDSAYLLYVRAFFLNAAERYPEALVATNKALDMVDKDAMLPSMLKEMQTQPGAAQMDLPGTVSEFRSKLEELKRSLEPRVTQMRARREAAKAKHKKKSR